MYKTKLQEFCQRRSWGLPDYETTKDGPHHNPRYTCNVTVNGVQFQTPSPFRTSKEAQNNVAKLAFDHFSNPNPNPLPIPQTQTQTPTFPQPSFPSIPLSLPQPTPPSSIASSSMAVGVVETLQRTSVTKPEVPDVAPEIEIKRDIVTPHIDNITAGSHRNDSVSPVIDMQRLYKNQLQNYAQKKNINLPLYSTEREGPPHASRFKCKVTVDGQTFESPQFFPTLKDAEHAAAKVALMSLTDPGAQEDDIALYKNLLQELAQKEGLRLPLYSTTRSGEAHMPTFVSNVELEGVIYTGQESKTKKQAEMSAAKVAYLNFKEIKGKLNQNSLVQPPAHRAQARAPSSHSPESTNLTLLQRHANSKSPVGYSPNSVTQNQNEADKTTDCAAEARSNLTAQPSSQHITVTSGRDSASPETSIGSVETASSSNLLSSFSSLKIDNLAIDSGCKPSAEVDISTYKKVTIYSRKANVEIAPGSTLLPISDENWVAHAYNE